jgi:DNA-binding NarL/FixJ family response regulator
MLPPVTIAAEALASVSLPGIPNSLNSAHRTTMLAGLTPRERDVLRLLAGGMTDREIAETLFISPRTVGGHVSNLLAKLGVDSRTAAAAWAVRNGVV